MRCGSRGLQELRQVAERRQGGQGDLAGERSFLCSQHSVTPRCCFAAAAFPCRR